ncbi:MAG: leucyl/phenylalanyl-tRNA--protein transferase [Planctomycetota bacterium]
MAQLSYNSGGSTMTTDIDRIIPYVIDAYRSGAYPMAEDGAIQFFKNNPRWILDLDHIHIPQRMMRYHRSCRFEMKVDTQFRTVVERCRADRPEWISDDLIELYVALHERGHAHSVEAWKDGELVGGLFGNQFGAAFLAESMAHTLSHASNSCIIYLIERLRAGGFKLCDIQYPNDHTMRFKPVPIKLKEFEKRFKAAVNSEAQF